MSASVSTERDSFILSHEFNSSITYFNSFDEGKSSQLLLNYSITDFMPAPQIRGVESSLPVEEQRFTARRGDEQI
jgi:hypothetical protein